MIISLVNIYNYILSIYIIINAGMYCVERMEIIIMPSVNSTALNLVLSLQTDGILKSSRFGLTM